VAELLGEQFEISRVGTDGDFNRAIDLLQELDGKVDAIGLGGIDVYLVVKEKRYAVKDGLRLMKAVKTTPVVDGSGLKNTLEREAVRILAQEYGLLQKGTRVLLVSSVDRFGMAEALAAEIGCNTTFGDLIFTVGIPFPIHTMRQLEVLATILLPIITKMPFQKLYPTGKKQDTQDEVKVKKYAKYFLSNQVIAGDFHLIRRYIPDGLQGQIILTNTTTKSDVEFLKAKGAGTLITTTPEYEGRSFGTNVMEAALVAMLGKPWEEISPGEYLDLLHKLDFKPRVVNLQ